MNFPGGSSSSLSELYTHRECLDLVPVCCCFLKGREKMMMMMPSLVRTGFSTIALIFSSLSTAAALMAMIPMIQSVSGDFGGSSVQNQL